MLRGRGVRTTAGEGAGATDVRVRLKLHSFKAERETSGRREVVSRSNVQTKVLRLKPAVRLPDIELVRQIGGLIAQDDKCGGSPATASR